MEPDRLMETVYPVYILERVCTEIMAECNRAAPDETLGRLLGYRLCWQGTCYIKVVDWISGQLETSHVHARFTLAGTRESELFLDERYGNHTHRPREVGLFHSHPFNAEPYFSSTDYQTFLAFPYDRIGNVFLLIDPLSSFFKAFVVAMTQNQGQKDLKQVPWISYSPKIQDAF